MCGICGIAGSIPKDQTVLNNTMRLMISRIAHRGPDGEGLWVDTEHKIALGHTRLAIIDVSDAGRQPLHLGKLHCVVNGEIYNYPELRESLETRYGAVFASHCDSEVVLHGYLYEGDAFFTRLNGMFAIALFDGEKNKLLLLRDRCGIKPLYYCVKDGRLAFASEIKSLLAAFNETQWEIDSLGLSQYMAYQTALGGRTLFSQVSLLTPGHMLTLTPSALVPPHSFLFYDENDDQQNTITNFEEAAAQYKTTFEESVSRHLLSDVPVASYISAGFDSASVAVQAALSSGKPLTCYTGNFGAQGDWYDETTIAHEAVNRFHGTHVAVNIGSEDLAAWLDNTIDALDEPKMGMGAFSQYMVAKEAAKNYKVILTGHGGDELFSGYPVFKLTGLKTLFSLKRNEVAQLGYFLFSLCKGFLYPEFGRYMPVVWPMRLQRKLLRSDTSTLRPWNALRLLQNSCKSTSQQLFKTYLEVYLPNLLVVEDKISMAHAIESRTPMLDNAMLKLSKTIPQSIKLNKGKLKAIIKHNAKHLLPNSFFNQPKRGFPTPLRLWLRGPLKGMLHDRLLGEHSRLPRLFDSKILDGYIRSYEHSYYQYIRPLDEIQSHRMWQLLSLEAWLRIWEEKYGITLVLQ